MSDFTVKPVKNPNTAPKGSIQIIQGKIQGAPKSPSNLMNEKNKKPKMSK
jgi:hypothetical protein